MSSIPVRAVEAHTHGKEQPLGSVHFLISCDPSVQTTFDRGVALLHSFAFDTAEATFREVAAQDPDCAMAYWGIASTFSRKCARLHPFCNMIFRDDECEGLHGAPKVKGFQ